LNGRWLWIAPLAPALVVPYGDADAQTAPTRDELSAKTAPATEQQRSRLSVDGDIERAPCPFADPQYASLTVNFASVAFNNLKGVDAASLGDSWRDMAGRDVPIASICEVRDRAATALRRAGYLAAVQIQPQRIPPGGVLSFDVLMAKLVRIQVRGDSGPSERLIARYLEPLVDQPVFNSLDAERAILLAKDLPGYDVRLTLRPAGTAPGEVVGEVAVTHTRFELTANVQNLGSRDTGRWGGLIRAQVNGLTGMGDRTSIGLFNTFETEEQTILQAGHSFLVGNRGLRIAADFTYAWTSPTLNPPAPIKSETLIATLAASYPLIRRQTKNAIVSGGFDLIDQDIRFGTTPLTGDNLRVFFARIDFDRIDPQSPVSTRGFSAAEPQWRFGGSVELRQGIGGLGASRPCGAGLVNCLPPFTPLSRIEGDPSAFVARAQAYFELRPIPQLAIATAVRAQYAPNPLAAYEEFSAGNYTIGRGYDAGTILGDRGVGTSTELRLFSLQPRSRESFAVQPFAFFDAVRVWNEDRLAPPYAPGRSNLYSAGGGVRAAWGNRARLDLTVAVPLTRAGLLATRPDPRVLLSLTAQVLPWRR
jgi:hemolysin activation/secretion protein